MMSQLCPLELHPFIMYKRILSITFTRITEITRCMKIMATSPSVCRRRNEHCG